MQGIQLGEKFYPYEDIKNLSLEEVAEAERSVLRFCQEWLRGRKEFSITTSGSTGVPKVITITRSNMEASAGMTCRALGLAEGDKGLVCLNTDYIAGKMMLVRSMLWNMTACVLSPSGNPLASLPAGQHFDFTALVPLQLTKILDETPEKIGILNSMKGILVGGSDVSAELEEKIRQVEAPVYLTYGMTETVSHIALKRLNGADRKDCLTALEGVSISQDERGCLKIKAAVTSNEWLVTNDLVEILNEKDFRWLGRIDNVINSGGVKVHPEAVEKSIEKIFLQLYLTHRFILSSRPDKLLGEQVVLVTEGELEPSLKGKLMSAMRAVLKPYEAPKDIVSLPKFPETATNKINRKEIGKMVGG